VEVEKLEVESLLFVVVAVVIVPVVVVLVLECLSLTRRILLLLLFFVVVVLCIYARHNFRNYLKRSIYNKTEQNKNNNRVENWRGRTADEDK